VRKILREVAFAEDCRHASHLTKQLAQSFVFIKETFGISSPRQSVVLASLNDIPWNFNQLSRQQTSY
jgi:L-lysine 2,3-aminomutase